MRNKSGEYPSAIIILGDLVQTEKEARNTSDSNKRGILKREVEDLINGINALEASPELKAAEERNLDTTDKYFNALMVGVIDVFMVVYKWLQKSSRLAVSP
ncbi:hypothetical protein Smp_181280 [Schistosoma mansoni]|uniref:hypothetical protein n=1 Tax=Schistosoma mansoni TaxID=6183 RepID=UPI00022DBF9C|nr:hypothetical protein Smp_181280 [Schistosoma mansoni]|eukprot:XP_018651596.1 hypothetical protein Smp_181280 [Schistosoma mansoni]